ncbi:hypothetical protein LAZ67_1006378 [Cordylochernes scorpioides]|uniref:Uncharacterized protein n=1 Tax=Cordylochernes scorpioides TaxID=51811 RepID=A0ABY6JZG3_9ARAC|nr:hypothetical protein LAZ67_1006378 [Cordylochernes scorpioides]
MSSSFSVTLLSRSFGYFLFSSAEQFDYSGVRSDQLQPVNPGLTLGHHNGPQQGIVIWSAILFVSRSPLLLIPGIQTEKQYVYEILWYILLLFLSHHTGLTFQQDNVRLHTDRVTVFKFSDYLVTS